MPLVFVHGVNVRYDDPADDPLIKARTALFRRFALAGLTPDPSRSLVLNPYWGHLAAKFPWNHGGLPTSDYEAFGSEDTIGVALLSAAPGAIPDSEAVLLGLAKASSLETAVDGLWRVASLNLDDRSADELAAAAVHIASYVDANPKPSWLDSVSNDSEWLTTLIHEAQTWSASRSRSSERPSGSSGTELEVFGVTDWTDRLARGVSRARDVVVTATDQARRLATRARKPADELFMKVREPVHRTLTTFLGDVFVYFRQ